MIYVKDSVHYTRRNDSDPLNIENIWIKILIKQTRIFFDYFIDLLVLMFYIFLQLKILYL